MYSELFVILHSVIMFMSLTDDGILIGFDENFASFINFWTFPILNMFEFFHIFMSFTILEAMFILHNDWISHPNTWKEGSIDQDFVISWNIIFNAPVVFCKNKSFQDRRQYFYSTLSKLSVYLSSVIMLISLNCNDLSSDSNGNFTAFVPSQTCPMLKMLRIMSLAVPEALLILNINWISDSSDRKERPIDQDFVFFQNNIFIIPVVFCKNK